MSSHRRLFSAYSVIESDSLTNALITERIPSIKGKRLEGNTIRRLYLISIAFVLLSLIAGCNQQPTIDVNEIIGQTEKTLRGFDEIETTAAAFDGKRDIKFRLMAKEPQTKEEAEILFNEILKSMVRSSNQPDLWDYYNGYFDIKNDDNDVIYEATKIIGEDLEITSSQN